MHQIAWDMRYGLPNQEYLRFVARYLLSGARLVDPFALDVPPEKTEDIYVLREDAEDEVLQPGSRIFLGPEGCGKSTLFQKLSSLTPQQALFIRLPLSRVGTFVPEQELMQGRVSLVTIEILVPYIFQAYWEGLLQTASKRERFLPRLRRDRQWMTTLRWFHHKYRPRVPEIPDDFELTAWLHAEASGEPFNPAISAEDILRELVRFVTAPLRFGTSHLKTPYTHVQILIDSNGRLSNEAITQLTQDLQRLYDLHLDGVQFKLFVDSACKPQIMEMNCVRQGRVPVYCLPPWSKEHLRQLLYRRLATWSPGESSELECPSFNWGTLIPDHALDPHARSQFVETIVDGAVRAYSKEGDGVDAPLHALRLARGLLAACSGCWEDCGYKRPLTYHQIRELMKVYWSTE